MEHLNLIDQLIEDYITYIKNSYVYYIRKDELLDYIAEYTLPEGWTVRKYPPNLYVVVKNMKYRGVPKVDSKKVKKVLEKHKINIIDDKVLEDIEEKLEKIIWSFEHIEEYWENDYVPFVQKMGLTPACVGRSGGWWGINIANMSPYEILSVEINKNEFVTKELKNEIATLAIKNPQWTREELIDQIIYHYDDILPHPNELIVVTNDFFENIRKIDEKLERDAEMFETIQSWEDKILEIA